MQYPSSKKPSILSADLQPIKKTHSWISPTYNKPQRKEREEKRGVLELQTLGERVVVGLIFVIVISYIRFQISPNVCLFNPALPPPDPPRTFPPSRIYPRCWFPFPPWETKIKRLGKKGAGKLKKEYKKQRQKHRSPGWTPIIRRLVCLCGVWNRCAPRVIKKPVRQEDDDDGMDAWMYGKPKWHELNAAVVSRKWDRKNVGIFRSLELRRSIVMGILLVHAATWSSCHVHALEQLMRF